MSTLAGSFARGVRAPAAPPLTLSDRLFLAGLLLALAMVADPFGWRLERVLLTKHLPLFIACAGALLTLCGTVLFPPAWQMRRGAARPAGSVLATTWPLLVLALWSIAGSLFARRVLDIHNTFLGMGLYMLFALLVARVIVVCAARERLIAIWLWGATLAAAWMVLGWATGLSDARGAWHEMENLVIPLALWHGLAPARAGWPRRGRLALMAVFLAAGVLLQKYTGLIVLAITLAWMWWAGRGAARADASPCVRRPGRALRAGVAGATGALLVAGALATLAMLRGNVLPQSNNLYRLTTYETAWRGFLAAPVFGAAFTGAATARFTGFDIEAARGVLPTHSDVLDIAAQGGTLGLLLWFAGNLRIARLAGRRLLRPRPAGHPRALGHTLACMVATGVVVYTFNPIMLQPVKALILWTELGMLVGLALATPIDAERP